MRTRRRTAIREPRRPNGDLVTAGPSRQREVGYHEERRVGAEVGGGAHEPQAAEILAGDDEERKLWVVSHLLRYAQWDDIWEFVSRDEVREMFPRLDLPDNLRAAWGRMLKVEAPVV